MNDAETISLFSGLTVIPRSSRAAISFIAYSTVNAKYMNG